MNKFLKKTVIDSFADRLFPYLDFIVTLSTLNMKMLMELTRFLEENEFDDVNSEFSNPAMDELGMDTIVYFPNVEPLEGGE